METKEGYAIQRHHISFFIILILLLILLAAGVYVFVSMQPHKTPQIITTPTPTATITTTNWKTYADTATGMSIMYPPDWTFTNRTGSHTSFTLTSPDKYTLSFIYGLPFTQQATSVPLEAFHSYTNLMLNHILFTKAYIANCVLAKQTVTITPTPNTCNSTINHITISTKTDFTNKVIPQTFSWNDKQTLLILYPPSPVKLTNTTFKKVDTELNTILTNFSLPIK